MYGARARIGLLVPSTNTVIEMEFFRMLPADVSVHSTRLHQPETDDPDEKIATVLKMHERLDAATEELASFSPSVIAYGCTTGSFVKGATEDRAMCDRMMAKTGIPFITTSSALVSALAELEVRRLALATPYIDSVNEHESTYLTAAAGVETVAMKGLGIVGNLPKGRLSPDVAAKLARQVDCPEAEAILISCTNFRTIESIETLENELGKPVITSNQATFWAALKAADVGSIHIRGYGRLLERLS